MSNEKITEQDILDYEKAKLEKAAREWKEEKEFSEWLDNLGDNKEMESINKSLDMLNEQVKAKNEEKRKAEAEKKRVLNAEKNTKQKRTDDLFREMIASIND